MSEIRWQADGLQVRCDARGFGVSGAGFYVWDEQLDDALEQAALIRNGRASRPAPAAPEAPPEVEPPTLHLIHGERNRDETPLSRS